MEVKICPSCQEKNNPSFNVCWKCGIDFATGKMSILRNIVEKKGSRGVIVYGSSLLIFSILSCMHGIGFAIATGSPELILRALVFFTPIGLLISSIGLLMLKNWARYLLIISASGMALLLVASFINELRQGISSLIKQPISLLFVLGYLLFLICIVYFFTRPKVKAQFK